MYNIGMIFGDEEIFRMIKIGLSVLFTLSALLQVSCTKISEPDVELESEISVESIISEEPLEFSGSQKEVCFEMFVEPVNLERRHGEENSIRIIMESPYKDIDGYVVLLEASGSGNIVGEKEIYVEYQDGGVEVSFNVDTVDTGIGTIYATAREVTDGERSELYRRRLIYLLADEEMDYYNNMGYYVSELMQLERRKDIEGWDENKYKREIRKVFNKDLKISEYKNSSVNE